MKSKPGVMIRAVLPRDVEQRLRVMAVDEGRTISGMTCRIIMQALARQRPARQTVEKECAA